MLKIKTNIIEKSIIGMACFLATSVFMLSIHAKDLVHYTDANVASQIGYHDISAKAASELHDHVDKQVVKAFDKGPTTDNPVLNGRTKQELELTIDEADPGLWGRLQETFLLWGVYASMPFTRA